MTGEKNYYQILGVDPFITQKALKDHFRKIIKLYHPDLHQGKGFENLYREILEAYDVLSSPRKRFDYDHTHHFGKETFFYETSSYGSSPSPPSPQNGWSANAGHPSRQETKPKNAQDLLNRIREEHRNRDRRPPPKKNNYLSDWVAWTVILIFSAGVLWLISKI